MFTSIPSELYVSRQAADFRKSYNGLAGLVCNELARDPSDGSLYVFFNRKRDQTKCLYYHNGGLCIWQKRLERGCFAKLPSMQSSSDSASYVVLTSTQLMMLIDGISLEQRRQQRRFCKPEEKKR